MSFWRRLGNCRINGFCLFQYLLRSDHCARKYRDILFDDAETGKWEMRYKLWKKDFNEALTLADLDINENWERYGEMITEK